MRKIFHEIVSLDDAKSILWQNFNFTPIGVEEVAIGEAHGRVLAEDIIAAIDVPPFDRSTVDGYAVKAEDVFGAYEDRPVKLKVVGKIEAGDIPRVEVGYGQCVEIATGAPLPRGANAVVMVEFTKRINDELFVFKPVSPGENVMSAGSDIMIGEKIITKGKVLTPREIGVLAALGFDKVKVYAKPKVAVISTGNELVKPGRPLEPFKIYDVNSYAIASSAMEDGCEIISLTYAPDDEQKILDVVSSALEKSDVVLISGGTSAGAGDLVYRVLEKLGEVLVHGLAVKPGKPTAIAKCRGKLVVGLPGYPVSALMIYNVLVSPALRAMAGKALERRSFVKAKMAIRVSPSRGRREFLPVSLVLKDDGSISAYPLTGGSGAITTLSLADGYVEISEDVEYVDEDEEVEVRLFGEMIKPAEMTIIGSHCIGLEKLVEKLAIRGFKEVKLINVGSTGGLHAIKRGEADIAGTHLLDEVTGIYNIPFVERYGLKDVLLIEGYLREQGFILAKGNPKNIKSWEDLLREDVYFINRNKGSGTRVFVDLNLKKLAQERGLSFDDVVKMVRGYSFEAKTHSAVAAAVAQGRADVGVGIRSAASMYGLDFIPLTVEKYDFVVRKSSLKKSAVKEFIEILRSNSFKEELEKIPGFKALSPGNVLLER